MECPSCKAEMRKRIGRYGQFWGCSKYPKCKTTVNIEKDRYSEQDWNEDNNPAENAMDICEDAPGDE